MVSLRNSEDYFVEADCRMYQEPDEEDELKRAARAGILLLEKNEELQAENHALRAQLEVLESEKMSLCGKLEEQKLEIETSMEERKHSYTELKALELALRNKSARIVHLGEQIERLRQDLAISQENCVKEEQRCEKKIADMEFIYAEKPRSNRSDVHTVNPAACDAEEKLLAEEYQKIVKKFNKITQENEALRQQLQNVQKDSESLQRNSIAITEYESMRHGMKSRSAALQESNKALHYELKEAKKLVDSQQSMIQMYKQIAESRPFSPDFDKQHDSPASLGSELFELNARLEKEIRDLKMQKQAVFSASNNDHMSCHRDEQLNSAENPFGHEIPDTTSYQDLLEESHKKDLQLERANQHRRAAILSQKALEDCNRVAQQEIANLTEQLQHQMNAFVFPRPDIDKSEDLDEGWVAEETFYPAPPSDLNSPLIKCLLEHWTSDKTKISRLTDWLHFSTQKNAEAQTLRLDKLPSEVAAGFIQLLVPILREKHGVSVNIKRRGCRQVVSDLILESESKGGSNSSLTLSESTEEVPNSIDHSLSLEQLSPEKTESNSDCPQLECMSGVRGVVSRFLRGETKFLYG